jgi:hypothetical protein
VVKLLLRVQSGTSVQTRSCYATSLGCWFYKCLHPLYISIQLASAPQLVANYAALQRCTFQCLLAAQLHSNPGASQAHTCRLITSSLVAGVLDTYCTHSWPSLVHSLGGRIEFSMSSVCVVCLSLSLAAALLARPPFLPCVVLTRIALSYLTSEL